MSRTCHGRVLDLAAGGVARREAAVLSTQTRNLATWSG
eukprot:CAMPEP_0185483694 /NCGR_PEP_ID=MMETSP1366-20130426/8751_1 /TAXON_ID=38817 /ORGANISM="Gephyrocapsa oceanica, Strain RCC1303" /LENGTH=37 /DNA_ID= /DNA_START= /DNA_END= /DNA_ORIENTATION=